MTDIDPEAEIELRTGAEAVTARMPLTGQVSQAWLLDYQRLADAAAVPAQPESAAGRVSIVVTLPVGGSQRQIASTLDAARALISAADAASLQLPAPASAEASVRDWWDRRRATAPGRPISKVPAMRTGIGAERRLTLAVTLAVAVMAQLLLPSRFSAGPTWLAPTMEIVLLAALFVVGRYGGDRRAATIRALLVVLVLVLVAVATFVTVRLVVDLIEGGPETSSAAALLRVGFGVWIYTIIAFTFLYWLLDSGGAEARIWHGRSSPDLAFPQHLNPQVARPGWQPTFADYLYLGFTNATAFSPTDVMPLARWAKLAMSIQAFASLAILGLVIARAVNIFK
jgi:hypothetical protein